MLERVAVLGFSFGFFLLRFSSKGRGCLGVYWGPAQQRLIFIKLRLQETSAPAPQRLLVASREW